MTILLVIEEIVESVFIESGFCFLFNILLFSLYYWENIFYKSLFVEVSLNCKKFNWVVRIWNIYIIFIFFKLNLRIMMSHNMILQSRIKMRGSFRGRFPLNILMDIHLKSWLCCQEQVNNFNVIIDESNLYSKIKKLTISTTLNILVFNTRIK